MNFGNTLEEQYANDIKDTHLGNQAAVNNSPVVSLNITCTVTQID